VLPRVHIEWFGLKISSKKAGCIFWNSLRAILVWRPFKGCD